MKGFQGKALHAHQRLPESAALGCWRPPNAGHAPAEAPPLPGSPLVADQRLLSCRRPPDAFYLASLVSLFRNWKISHANPDLWPLLTNGAVSSRAVGWRAAEPRPRTVKGSQALLCARAPQAAPMRGCQLTRPPEHTRALLGRGTPGRDGGNGLEWERY